jgi:hypothetical protein
MWDRLAIRGPLRPKMQPAPPGISTLEGCMELCLTEIRSCNIGYGN